ncbi:hypothetical protein Tco_1204616 [Tanacetum coccineum]
MERKIDEWEKSQNISSEKTNWTEPQALPQAYTEQVNVVFTRSEKSDDSLKTQKDPPPPIIVDNKTKKDKPIKTTKKGYHAVCVVEENERIHEDKKLKRRSKLKIKIPRQLSTVLAITGAYELGLS